MPHNVWTNLTLPGVIALVSFLAYGSQILFCHIQPHALEPKQAFIFNALVGCIWITYTRACFTDPGWVPSAWNLERSASQQPSPSKRTPRWCRKCEAFKPPRAHHCKICQRCIPKMDHHCPWTINCVSHRTFPHFLRFLFYATASMTYLEYFIYLRVAVIWRRRDLPSYLGPTPTQLVFLFILMAVNSITLFALAILLALNVWCLGGNVTTIEGWEIERHEALVRRARVLGGYLDGPDGTKVKIRKQEFPYDIGILRNIKQGMGGTLLLGLWPFMASPSNESGLDFETNGFEDASMSWPPPDPDRMPRFNNRPPFGQPFVYNEDLSRSQTDVDAFHRRQHQDLKRYDEGATTSIPRRPWYEGHDNSDRRDEFFASQSSDSDHLGSGKEGWRDSEGDRLNDFGVDEDAEFYDEDDMPLAELLRRRRERTMDEGSH